MLVDCSELETSLDGGLLDVVGFTGHGGFVSHDLIGFNNQTVARNVHTFFDPDNITNTQQTSMYVFNLSISSDGDL